MIQRRDFIGALPLVAMGTQALADGSLPKGADAEVRVGSSIRLGGYCYMGDSTSSWFSRNLDLLVLLSRGSGTPMQRAQMFNTRLKGYEYFLTNQVSGINSGPQTLVADRAFVDKLGASLKAKAGAVISSPRGPRFNVMDLGSPAWLDYSGAALKAALAKVGSTGLVFDEVPLALRDPWVTEQSRFKSDDEVQACTRDYLLALRRRFGCNLMINAGALHRRRADGQSLWQYFDDAITGAWHEGWIRYYMQPEHPHSGSMWEDDIASAERLSAAGRPYIAATAYRDRDELEYALACYLLAKCSDSMVFQPMAKYTEQRRGGFHADVFHDEVVANPDLFELAFGAPLGRRQALGPGWIRRFERGAVVVNSTASGIPMATPTGHSRVRNDTVPSTLLPPFSAWILHRT